jgi:aminoglycoside phosphotransferase family enzyme
LRSAQTAELAQRAEGQSLRHIGAAHVDRMTRPTLADKVSALRDPSSFPDRPVRVEAIETHFAWVFLTGGRAYKLKKPLRLKGADLRTLAARERNCHQELRVNQCLAADTYLRIAPLARHDGRLAVDGPGEVADWLVVMRELDRRQMLNARLRDGRVEPGDIDRLVQALARFYRGLTPAVSDAQAYLGSVRARIDEAASELSRPEFGLPPEPVRELSRVLQAAGERSATELAARARAGHVVEAHGDLRAEHVWLGDPVQVIDALEFERRLRILDTAEEIAMLVVDLEHLGFSETAGAFVERYRQVLPDAVPAALLAFYESLRAATRAKVAIWHLDDAGQFPDGAPWRQRALEFVALATRAAARVA